MFLRTFLRTRCDALFDCALAMVVSQSCLFLQSRSTFARTLASTGVGTCTLTAHGQTATVAETTVAAAVMAAAATAATAAVAAAVATAE